MGESAVAASANIVLALSSQRELTVLCVGSAPG